MTLFWGSVLLLSTIFVGGLATGRWGLEMVRDATDAKLGRWLIGAMALAAGIVVALLEPLSEVRIPAIALAISGGWTIATAARFAPGDRTVGMVERAITASALEAAREARSRREPTLDVHSSWWALLLGVACVIGLAAMMVFFPLDLAGRPHLPAWAVIAFSAATWLFGLAVIVPTVWLVQRRLRGIPIFRLDGTGVVMGVDRERDRRVDWADLTGVDVSVRRGGGITDEVVRFAAAAATSNAPRSLKWRIVETASALLYGAPFAMSMTGLTASATDVLAFVSKHRPDALPRTNGGHPGR